MAYSCLQDKVQTPTQSGQDPQALRGLASALGPGSEPLNTKEIMVSHFLVPLPICK